jgi:hypothetical protein
MAGPLADESGALLIFDVATIDELARLIDEDPYFRAPGVMIANRREWAPFLR